MIYIRYFLLVAITLTFLNGCSEVDLSKNTTSETQFVTLPDSKIAYRIYGSGDPLLMCMGYASNMDLWSTGVIESLRQKYKVIVFDYRGMGSSTNTRNSFTINTLAEDVNELLLALKIDKTNVLGWSMGGYVAQMFAINHPDKVNKLVLYATNFGGTTIINPTQKIIDILSNPSSTPLEMLGTLFPDPWLATHPEPWKFLPESKEPVNGQTIGLQYGAVQKWLSPGGGSAGNLYKLKMPVLLICGNQDKVVPYVNSYMLADSIKTSSLINISNSGHGLMYQLPDLFSSYLISFLTD